MLAAILLSFYKPGEFKVPFCLRASELSRTEMRELHPCVGIHGSPASARKDGHGTAASSKALGLSVDVDGSDGGYVAVTRTACGSDTPGRLRHASGFELNDAIRKVLRVGGSRSHTDR